MKKTVRCIATLALVALVSTASAFAEWENNIALGLQFPIQKLKIESDLIDTLNKIPGVDVSDTMSQTGYYFDLAYMGLSKDSGFTFKTDIGLGAKSRSKTDWYDKHSALVRRSILGQVIPLSAQTRQLLPPPQT